MSPKRIAALFAGSAFVAVAVAGAYVLAIFPDSPGPGQGFVREIEIPAGVGPRQLASRLDEAGAISSRSLFALWIRATGGLAGIKAGRFRIVDNATPQSLVAALSGRGIEKGVKITIPEGFTLAKIGAALEKAGLEKSSDFIEAAVDLKLLKKLGAPGPTFEGYLFPDTYYLEKSADSGAVVEIMWSNFQKHLSSIGAFQGEELKRLVTLASIVQAEAKLKEEMPVIAGVYRNRLDSPEFPTRLLQADPSTAYGCEPYVEPRGKSCAGFKGILTRQQIEDPDNPYNTYVHRGLPPGPICSPGIDAIEAAVKPERVPYFYFVADSNGRHSFSVTFEEHQKAVSRYRKGG